MKKDDKKKTGASPGRKLSSLVDTHVIVLLTVKEILEENIARKLA